MKGDDHVIELLNKALSVELAAINQYFLHARIYKNWGLEALGKHEYDESIEEMHHADKLIERILFLEGLPQMQTLSKLSIGRKIPDCLSGDLTLEFAARELYVEAIDYCEQVKDYTTRDLLQENLRDTEDHIDYLETQIELVEKVGLQNYLQTAMGEITT
jgi:bacterioferritin